MNTPVADPTRIQDRVAKLERSNRNLRIAFGLFVCLSVLGARFFLFSMVPSSIQARQVLVRGEKGELRAALDPSGLTLYDSSGKTRGKLYAGEDAAAVVLLSGEAQSRVRLGIGADGKGLLEVPSPPWAATASAAAVDVVPPVQ